MLHPERNINIMVREQLIVFVMTVHRHCAMSTETDGGVLCTYTECQDSFYEE